MDLRYRGTKQSFIFLPHKSQIKALPQIALSNRRNYLDLFNNSPAAAALSSEATAQPETYISPTLTAITTHPILFVTAVWTIVSLAISFIA